MQRRPEDIQTTSGLVITRNVSDSAEVTHFKITNITNGTLFKNDGTTPIANNSFITFAEGNAGLKFTPGPNLFSPSSSFSFRVQSSLSNSDAGLGGGFAFGIIGVGPVADTPSVTDASTTVNTQTDFRPGNHTQSGGWLRKLLCSRSRTSPTARCSGMTARRRFLTTSSSPAAEGTAAVKVHARDQLERHRQFPGTGRCERYYGREQRHRDHHSGLRPDGGHEWE
jgi:hypothetical protein